MNSRLSSDAPIVHSAIFEIAVVKVQLGKNDSLQRQERAVLSSLKAESTWTVGDSVEIEGNLSFAERALKRQRRSCGTNACRYIDTRFLLPTSNDCERLFSTVGHLLTDRRKSISPANLEAQIFLNSNCDLWTAHDVNKLTLS